MCRKQANGNYLVVIGSHYSLNLFPRYLRGKVPNILQEVPIIVYHSVSFPYQFPFVISVFLCFAVVKDLKYVDSHEWAKVDGNLATIGITDHAQDHLGDVVYVELPEVGANVSQGGSFGAVESVKATSDINSPVSGKVAEVNEELSSSPGLVSNTILGV